LTEVFKRLALVGDVWVLWLLLVASVISLSVIFERLWIFRKNKSDFAVFLDKLGGYLEEGNLSGARQVANGTPGIEARVASAGIENLHKGSASVEEAMTSRLVLERSKLEKKPGNSWHAGQ